MKTKKQITDDIFYNRIPSEMKVKLNFRSEIVSSNDKDRSIKFSLILDDPRWFQTKINNELVYIDSVDGDICPASTLVESFYRNNRDNPVYLENYQSSNRGAKTVDGLKKLISNDKLEEAFLSCHSIFLKRLRVLLFCHESNDVSFEIWYEWNKKFRGADILIKEIFSLGIIDENFKETLIEYNRDRNRIDHEMSTGSIESRDILFNLNKGLVYLDELEVIFKKITKKFD